ncbi:MAG: hypothetical protein JXR05_05630 [Flavobacteriaceae bacterium]
MIISAALKDFHQANNLPKDGGENDNFFYIQFKPFTFKLPNPKFRRKVIHIHDIQHVLYDCDTSWRGESFISGWEIATGMWKHLPIGLFSISGLFVGLFLHPKEVSDGFKEGLQSESLIDSKIPKEELLNLSISELKNRLKKKKSVKFNWISFLFWCFVSIVISLFPLLVLIGFLVL